ncbi:MAG: hypothetical protein E6371_18070 [Terrisporobacter othiniensis]|uniref:hypothetical protein n=1 Tax=Terrisporobacter othiniensis TaxID=1577792 RepID=UPI00290EBDD3|nr:hypothetical protein [Terrisporobacter othiniensis]MDU6986314.1 hypothetical protein [Terrisporobacter othiniensis]
MSKILMLYEIEFKRIKKVYFSILSLIIISNLIWFIYNLNLVAKEVQRILNIRGGLGLLKSEEVYMIIKNGGFIYSLYSLSFFFMILGLIWCLYYTLLTWYKDFSSKTTVAYTLFTLPCNKFNIFLSKLLIVLSFIYGVLATQHILWILEILIMKSITSINISEIIYIINYNSLKSFLSMGISIYLLEILMYYVFSPILAVIVLFTGVLIHKSFDKIGGFLGLFYMAIVIFMYLYISSISMIFTDELLRNHILYYIVTGVLSLIISYNLLNKKIHI